MTKAIATSGAREIRKMIKNSEGLRTIIAFAKGMGFDLDSVSSLVYIKNENEVCTTVNGNTNYDIVKYGF